MMEARRETLLRGLRFFQRMKDALSSLELYYLVRDLQSLVGARLDKAYQGVGARKHDLLLQLHQSGEGKRLLRILLPSIAYAPGEKPPYGKTPGHFAIFLRRRLGNARLVALQQRGFERILELAFENKHGTFTLLVELLPPGNLLVLDEHDKILGLLQPQRHGQRLLRGGAQYQPPPPAFDTRNASDDELHSRLAATNKDSVVKALASDLGLGSRYAEEACARAGVDKGAKPTKELFAQLVPVVRQLFAQESGAVVAGGEAFPFHLVTVEAEQELSSFSAAIEKVLPDLAEESEEQAVKKAKRPLVEIQREQLAGYERAAVENQRKGELLYEHYQEVQALLDAIKSDRKKLSWPAIKEKYRGRAEIDETKGVVTIELGAEASRAASQTPTPLEGGR